MSKIRYRVGQCGIVILAAGSSSRLGKPKQLLSYKGKSLLQRTTDIALKSGIGPVITVLGSGGDIIRDEISDLPVHIIHNKEWMEGIASSLRVGLKKACEIKPGIDGIIFMVCDQPHVTSLLVKNLLTKQQESGLPIVASIYKNNLGTPALFHEIFFDDLLKLKGDTGAKNLIKKNTDKVADIEFPLGIIDIDTEEDLKILFGKSD